MLKIDWRYLKTSISEEDIVKVENKIGFKLPNDYIKLVLQYNGGRPRPNRFNTKTTTGRVLQAFLSLHSNDQGSIFSVLEWVGDRLDKNMVPFAEDPAGNYLCFKHYTINTKIMFWDHENNESELVCDSITELIGSLY